MMANVSPNKYVSSEIPLDKRDMIVTLIPTFTCNLNCSYCYVCKDDIANELKKIENDLIEAYKTPSYFVDLFRTRFPGRDISSLQLWGGEPLLHAERTFPTVAEFLKEYDSINEVSFSTNLAHANAIPNITSIIDMLSRYRRKFYVSCQISLDGPSDINDVSRGIGTTDRVIENVKKLESIPKYKNIKFVVHFKPTLSKEEFPKFKDINYCKGYYKFFDELYEILEANDNLKYHKSLPTIVVPEDYSKEDGINFSIMTDNLMQLEEYKDEFKFNNERFVMYNRKIINEDNSTPDYIHTTSFCGFLNNITLLPNDMSFNCHRCVDDVIEICKGNNPNTSFLVHLNQKDFDKKYPLLFDKVNICKNGTNGLISEDAIIIRTLAHMGEISSIYKDPNNAYHAAVYFAYNFPRCCYENIRCTGTFHLQYSGLFKLFLNGSLEKVDTYNRRKRNAR